MSPLRASRIAETSRFRPRNAMRNVINRKGMRSKPTGQTDGVTQHKAVKKRIGSISGNFIFETSVPPELLIYPNSEYSYADSPIPLALIWENGWEEPSQSKLRL